MRRFIPPYVWLALAAVPLVAATVLTLWSELATEHDGDGWGIAAGAVLFGVIPAAVGILLFSLPHDEP